MSLQDYCSFIGYSRYSFKLDKVATCSSVTRFYRHSMDAINALD